MCALLDVHVGCRNESWREIGSPRVLGRDGGSDIWVWRHLQSYSPWLVRTTQPTGTFNK